MLANYYTLLHITHDLHRLLIGSRLTEAFSQERNQLVLSFLADDAEHWLIVSCEPSSNYLYLRPTFSRAKKNTIDFFAPLIGQSVERLSFHPSDRQINFAFDAGLELVIQFFGSTANVFLIEKDGTILEAFLRPRGVVGKILPRAEGDDSLGIPTVAEIGENLRSFPALSLLKALKMIFPKFGSLLIREVLYRAQCSVDQEVSELSVDSISRLSAVTRELIAKLTAKAEPRVYYDDTHPLEFSIVPLQHLERYRCEGQTSLHEAVRTFVSSTRRDRTFLAKKQALLSRIKQELERTNRALEKVRKEILPGDRSAVYEKHGGLLMANLHLIRKGMKNVEVEDLYSPKPQTIKIELDERRSPSQNAERYFEKAKKGRKAFKEATERNNELTKRVSVLESLSDQVESLQTTASLEEYTRNHPEEFAKAGIAIDKKARVLTKPEVPFRVFTVAGGFQVWVGKSSANNDLLTMKYARPNDLWFHARGSSGSHVVLRLGTGKGELSKRAMEETASIAAYYSKMRNAKTVPVAMTERKYVRKPKGAPVGTVVIEREKMLFVKPHLPDGHTEPG